MTILGQDQLRFGDRSWRKGVQFSELAVERLVKAGQAAHAFRGEGGVDFDLRQQALWGARDSRRSVEFGEIQIWGKVDLRYFEGEIPAVPDVLIKEETNVQPEGR